MNLFQAIVLGLVQGLTEFIPISSSAHLVLVRWLFAWPRGPEAFAFDVLVQVARWWRCWPTSGATCGTSSATC